MSPPGASSPELYALAQSASTSPAVRAGLASVCSARVCAISSRPLRAAEARRLRSSEEGGDGITTRPGDRRARVLRRATPFFAAFVRPAARRFAPVWAFEARLLGFAAFFAVRV